MERVPQYGGPGCLHDTHGDDGRWTNIHRVLKMFFSMRSASRDVMQRLDLPLVVFGRYLLEWSVAGSAAIGGALLLVPGVALMSPAHVMAREYVPEGWWGHAFLWLGIFHSGLLFVDRRWALVARQHVLAATTMTYAALAALIGAVAPLSWAFYSTGMFVYLAAVCLVRVWYELRQRRALEDAGLG